ncbi:hypothetical protein SAMN02927903_03277 [Flavobacterium caeni]|uniref:Uncharacterized protein n=1 Tax=Flavobacterium caeni TaxID=490189 RepID=A0A1G5KFI4_9FLAO|nr:hypothetical protein SAMN02927903_03277 [Flavobacterium caeni]
MTFRKVSEKQMKVLLKFLQGNYWLNSIFLIMAIKMIICYLITQEPLDF